MEELSDFNSSTRAFGDFCSPLCKDATAERTSSATARRTFGSCDWMEELSDFNSSDESFRRFLLSALQRCDGSANFLGHRAPHIRLLRLDGGLSDFNSSTRAFGDFCSPLCKDATAERISSATARRTFGSCDWMEALSDFNSSREPSAISALRFAKMRRQCEFPPPPRAAHSAPATGWRRSATSIPPTRAFGDFCSPLCKDATAERISSATARRTFGSCDWMEALSDFNSSTRAFGDFCSPLCKDATAVRTSSATARRTFGSCDWMEELSDFNSSREPSAISALRFAKMRRQRELPRLPRAAHSAPAPEWKS